MQVPQLAARNPRALASILTRTLAGLAVVGSAVAQSAPTSSDHVPTPVTAIDPSRAGPRLPNPFAGQEVAGGEVLQQEILTRDDAIPLPDAAVYQTTPAGDVLVKPASGDSFFLGFAAGRYYPPADERIDPLLVQTALSAYADGRPTQETYAFVMFQQRITRERIAELESMGVRVIEFHPFYTLKVALPVSAIDLVASHDAVRWIGVPRPWQKVHPKLAQQFAAAHPGEAIDVYIDVFDSDRNSASTEEPIGTLEQGGPDGDTSVPEAASRSLRVQSNGWQQRALATAGVQITEYVDEIRAFRAKLNPASLEALASSDFVQFIEPDLPESLSHDESMPMVSMDTTRGTYNGTFSDTVVIGQADSGIQYSHAGLGGHYWHGSNLSGSANGVTIDLCGHGSHVNGTIRGDGGGTGGSASYQGAARLISQLPELRFANLKMFDDLCGNPGVTEAQICSFMHATYVDSNGAITPPPHAINNSRGTIGTGWVGTEADPRTLDADAYSSQQLWVFAAGNEGSAGSTIRLEATAKNVLTVGSVDDYFSSADPGVVSSFSSRGACGDNRWKPNLCAPGSHILSVDSSTTGDYVEKDGTSMAAPHVTGLAAQLVDRVSFLQSHRATTLGAVLMATAITRNNVLLTSPSSVPTDHLNQYGTGRIDARRANVNSSEALYFWGFSQGSAGFSYADVPVNAGATRIEVVMWYHEPAASAGASQALVNDLDMYIDQPPLQVAGNAGEYVTQQSPRDNTEVRILNNPIAGTWRIKVWPDSVTSTCKVGLCAVVTYGDTTPDGTLSVTANDQYVKPNASVDIDATLTCDEYLSSAVYLDTTSAGSTVTAASTTHKDGAVTNLINNHQLGRDLELGTIPGGQSRSASWTAKWATEGVKNWQVNARSENAVDKTSAVTIYVDGTPPTLATNVHSTTHTVNVWSNVAPISFAWTAATDAISGVDGYSVLLSSAAPASPDTTKDIGAVTSYNTTLPGTNGTFYINLKTVDKSGNWSTGYASAGPFKLDQLDPSSVSGLSSSTHFVGIPGCSTTVGMVWSPTPDSGGSGLAGYSYVWDHSPSTQPLPPTNLGPTTFLIQALAASTQPWYFHLTSIDNAGNYANATHSGPYFVNPNPGTVYCTAKVNSLGCTPQIAVAGTPNAGQNTGYVISASSVRNLKTGLLFYGINGSHAVPFQGGTHCVNTPTKRSVALFSGGSSSGNDCTGVYAIDFSSFAHGLLGGNPLPEISVAGTTVNAQFWGRDPGFPAPNNTTLSDAVEFVLCQ